MAQQPIGEVDICNLGLGHLHQKPITSIEDPVSNAEIVCAQWYHQVRRSSLATGAFGFSRKRALLPQLATEAEFEYAAKYKLPNDFVRLLRIGETPDDSVTLDYCIENNEILINDMDAETLPIVYVFDFKNIAKMDSTFIELFAIDFAIAVSPFFKPDPAVRQLLRDQRAEILKRAKAISGQQNKPRLVHNSRMMQARRTSGVL